MVKRLKGFFSRPVVFALAMVMIWIIVNNIFGAILFIFEPMLGDAFPYVYNLYIIALMCLLVLLFKKKMGDDFVVGVRLDNLGKGLVMCLPVLLLVAINLLSFLSDLAQQPIEIPAAEIPLALINIMLSGMNPGITEECLLRVMVMGGIMHLYKGRKHRLALAVGVSSGIFGLLHLINILAGADIVVTLFQVLYSTGVGLFFAGVYARSRNILAAMIAHSLIDISSDVDSAFYPALYEASAAVEHTIGAAEMIVYGGIALITASVGLFLLRPSKRHEIEAHWGSLSPAELPGSEE